MKSIFLAAALLSAPFAAQAEFANTKGACPAEIFCGTYETEADSNGVRAGFKFVPTEQANQAHMIFTFRLQDGTEIENVSLLMVFDQDHSFKALQNGKPYATGICLKSVCTYAMFPNSGPDGINGMGGVLTFKGDTLEQASFISNDKGQSSGLSVYKKR